MTTFLDTKLLKKLAIEKPIVHGNGFIQLNLGQNYRLNFWGHQDIPKQVAPTPIHDHAYDFISTILYGEMFNTRFSATAGREYKIYQPVPRTGEDTELKLTSFRVGLRESSVEQLNTVMDPDLKYVQSYFMLAGQIHKTEAFTPAVTLMKKISKPDFIKKYPASVFVPKGLIPDNDFDRNSFDTETLWEIIDDIVQSSKKGELL